MIQFYKNINFSSDKPILEKVLQTEESVEVKMTLAKGVELKKHRVISRIIVQVLQGEIDFEKNGERFQMQAGDLITVERNVFHSLKAREDSLMRLTIFEVN